MQLKFHIYHKQNNTVTLRFR